MKKIAVVSTSAAIGSEKGLNRMFFLAEMLAENGFEVDFITSDFHHWSKKHRDKEVIKSYNSKCNVVLLHEPGYKKNVDPRRIYSHYVLARNIAKYLRTQKYDLVYNDIPDNHVSALSAKYAKKNNIPFVIDVEDLWPKAMRMAFNVPVISDICFSYFSHDAKTAYSLSSAVIGSSDCYRDDSLNYGIEIPVKKTVYVGNNLDLFDEGVRQHSAEIQKPENEYWITYAGSLSTSYDIDTLIKSVGYLTNQGEKNVRLIILGDGSLRAEFESLAEPLGEYVSFKGYVSYDVMAAYLVKSDVLVNSLKKNAPQSIVSKIGDYLAAKKPMINTCIDKEFWQKVEHDGFGVNVEPENVKILAEKILFLKNNPELSKEMGEKARKIAEEQFNRKQSYMNIVDLLKSLTNN